MKRIHLYGVAIAMALVPAVLGLWGNASFSQNVPVRTPTSATTSQPTGASGDGARHDASDDRSGGPGHDRSGPRTASPTGNATAADDHGRVGRRHESEPERGDDRGGDRHVAEDQSGHHRGEGEVSAPPGDTRVADSSGHGRDDNRGDDRAHGTDDHGVDDHGRGSGGHGSDD
jgi:hypothetical protein